MTRAGRRTTPIVIYGAGGHGRETAVLIEALIADGNRFELLGFLDDDASRHGTVCGDLPVVGGAAVIAGRQDIAVALGIGSPRVKRELVTRLTGRLALPVSCMPSLVHPGVAMHRRVSIGLAVQVHAGSILTTDIAIGSYATCNRRVDVSHDCTIGAYATLAPSVVLAGAVTIGEGADVGANVTCVPGVHVGNWSVVGAGAVVTRHVADGWTVAGVPARPFRDAEGNVISSASVLQAV